MKKIIEKLKNPAKIFAILFSVFAIAVISLTITLLCIGYNSMLMYLLYFVSAIVLSYWVYIIVIFAPIIKNDFIDFLRKFKFMSELLDSYGYRSVIFAILSFILNISFAVIQGVLAIMSRSIWYGALATYYIIISCIRGGLVGISRKRNKQEYSLEKQIKSYRNCGIYLMLLNLALIPAIVQMVVVNQSFKYVGIMIYVMATFTFYKLGISIYNFIKAKPKFFIDSIK